MQLKGDVKPEGVNKRHSLEYRSCPLAVVLNFFSPRYEAVINDVSSQLSYKWNALDGVLNKAV